MMETGTAGPPVPGEAPDSVACSGVSDSRCRFGTGIGIMFSKSAMEVGMRCFWMTKYAHFSAIFISAVVILYWCGKRS